MLRLVCIAVALAIVQAIGAERVFDFDKHLLNQTPPGFRSALGGKGAPPDWRIVLDEVPPRLAPLTPEGAASSKRHVLAQLSEDITDERYPLLIFEEESFADFTLTTRFKIVRGLAEQMAGIAFRLQDENNYYYVRASSLGKTFRFFKIVKGERSAPIGPEIEIPRGIWHELIIECRGNQIKCLLNGKQVIPAITDNSFMAGKIAFWTKSDSVSHFADTRIQYTPREGLAESMVREMVRKYPRLVDLRIYAVPPGKNQPEVIASTDLAEIGRKGDSVERHVIAEDAVYYGKSGKNAVVTLPLRDRNGDTVAAICIVMKSFKGQTEQNAVARAQPLVKEMELRLRSSRTLFE